jgi:hypothetical protein
MEGMEGMEGMEAAAHAPATGSMRYGRQHVTGQANGGVERQPIEDGFDGGQQRDP